MSGMNRGGSYEEAIRRINSLDVSEGKKIRYKMVLALTMPDDKGEVGKKLFKIRAIDHVPLEIMPKLFEMLHQRIGYNGFGEGITKLAEGRWDPLFHYSSSQLERAGVGPRLSLDRIYSIVRGWNIQLLFERGSGVMKVKMEKEVKAEAARTLKQTKQSKRKRRSRHDDDDDSDDEDWKPSAGLKPKRSFVREQGRFNSRYVYKVNDMPTRRSERLG